MTTAEQGKFCSQCNKTVFDFTTATDAEIVKHIEAMKGELFCGRFEDNQLDRWIERSDIKTNNPRLYKFLISFMLLGAAQGANAQTTPVQEKVATQRKLDSLLNMEALKAETGEMVCDTVRQDQRGIEIALTGRVGGVNVISTKSRKTAKIEPLIIVDGYAIKQKTLKKIDPKRIVDLTVFNSTQGLEKYGSKAVNGVIIITSNYTKKELRHL